MKTKIKESLANNNSIIDEKIKKFFGEVKKNKSDNATFIRLANK